MNQLCSAVVLLVVASSACAGDWSMNAQQSKLRFESSYDGDHFTGEFKRFTSTLCIDPADPAATDIDVSIELASVDTRNEERDGTLTSEDFFWAEQFPTARFKSTQCSAGSAPGRISCQATLTIRDKTVPLVFPFDFAVTGNNASLKAAVSLDRMAFDVGGGDWADAGLIPHQVKVSVDLLLEGKAP